MNVIALRTEPLIREIPLSSLAVAPENDRATPSDSQADAEFKASIAALTLLENLVVRADDAGERDGTERYSVASRALTLTEIPGLTVGARRADSVARQSADAVNE